MTHNLPPRKVCLSLALFLILTASVAAQTARPNADEYWDDIELIDGQVIHGVIIDTVKEKVLIQLTTRDVISLPSSSVRKIVKAAERSKNRAAEVAIRLELDRQAAEQSSAATQAKVEVAVAALRAEYEAKAAAEAPVAGLIVLTSKSKGWDPSWAKVGAGGAELLRFELEDGASLDGFWIETKNGRAIVSSTPTAVFSIARTFIRRVVVTPALAPLPPAPIEPEVAAEPQFNSAPQTDLVQDVSNSFDLAWSEVASFTWPTFNIELKPAKLIGSRTFFLPTAHTLPAGRFHLNQSEIMFTRGSYGITDSFQVQTSTVVPFLFIPGSSNLGEVDIELAGHWPAANADSPELHLAGLVVVTAAPTLLGTLGAGIATLETPGWQVSVMGGVAGLAQSLDGTWGTLGASTIVQFHPSWAFMAEFGSLFNTSGQFGGGAYFLTGVRFGSEFLSFDLGLGGTTGGSPVIPVLNVGYTF